MLSHPSCAARVRPFFTSANLLRGAAYAGYISPFLAQRTSGPVVLVGHSHGRFAITNAATGGGDVKALVYVDAFAPDEGDRVPDSGRIGFSALRPGPDHRPRSGRHPGGPDGDAEAFLKPDAVHNLSAQHLPEADR